MTLISGMMTGLLIAAVLLIPLVIKWELDKTMTFPAILVIGLFAGLAAASPALPREWPLPAVLFLQACLIAGSAAALLLLRFFRDPERTCTPDGQAVLSAADGRVIYVKKMEAGQIPVSEKHGRFFKLREFAGTGILESDGYLIGTAMTYLDVHVNRAPVAGTVRRLEHIGGRFFSLKKPEAVFQNERVATVIQAPGRTIGVVQIASRLVRNIIPFVDEGTAVRQGQRIGKIRFGSQVDLIVPAAPGLRILVAPGDKLKAGVSVVARYE